MELSKYADLDLNVLYKIAMPKMKTQPITLKFQAYEIDNIKKALEVLAKDIKSKSNDSYYYTQGWQKSEKYLSQIAFTLKSIERQIPKEPQCRIYGSEYVFERFVPISEIDEKALDIWKNPTKYATFSDAYYDFLKFLWIEFPNGKIVRLAEHVQELEKS